MKRHFPCLPLIAALSLAAPVAWASEPSTEAASAAEPSLTIALEIDVEVGDESKQAAVVSATEAALGELEQQQGLQRAKGDPADLSLRVRIWQPEPKVLVVDSEVEFEGEILSHQEGVVCMDCSAEDAAAKALTILPEALDQARAARAQAEPPPPAIEEASDEDAPPPSSKRPGVLGPVGYAGIGASVLGLGGAIVGAVYLHRGRVLENDPGAAVLEYTDHRPLGVGLLGAGLGVMVVGNVLLGVDLGILRPRRESRGSARIELTGVSVLARESRGVTISGRF
ncbi:MAG: hypothetical protein R6X02_16825 [Enhygromyxa sp.]